MFLSNELTQLLSGDVILYILNKCAGADLGEEPGGPVPPLFEKVS